MQRRRGTRRRRACTSPPRAAARSGLITGERLLRFDMQFSMLWGLFAGRVQGHRPRMLSQLLLSLSAARTTCGLSPTTPSCAPASPRARWATARARPGPRWCVAVGMRPPPAGLLVSWLAGLLACCCSAPRMPRLFCIASPVPHMSCPPAAGAQPVARPQPGRQDGGACGIWLGAAVQAGWGGQTGACRLRTASGWTRVP